MSQQLFYTFLQLKNAVEHALGRVPDARTSSGAIVNRALNYLANYHPWSWRVAITTLAFTGAQSYIDLPPDFGELLSLYGYAAKYTSIIPVNAERLAGIRVHYGSTDGTFLAYMVSSGVQAVNELSVPVLRLEIGPTPAATLADALYLTYRRVTPGFTESGAGDDAKVPNVPIGSFHALLICLCRAFAQSTEEDGGNEWQLAKELLQRAVDQDGRMKAPNLGLVEGSGVCEYIDGDFGGVDPTVNVLTPYDP